MSETNNADMLTSKTTKKNVEMEKQKLSTPKAYKFMEIYDQRKKMMLNQQQENERKLREFRANPMPNFGLAHQLINNRKVMHRITVPITPNVLKTSLLAQPKRQQQIQAQIKLKEENLLKTLKPNFKALPMPPFKMEPFKPANRQSLIDMKPFNLKSEERGLQRKLFNGQNMKIMENKNRRMEEERKNRELQLKQKLRQLTNFKANRNPFGYLHK
ncbi:targeting protein for Xklp2 [Drosophila tropicalis]|uniref:targeting protein for Xklp2 n=1 Tax=Drosophila tropicalis TaxID=46794 RepID=UPI0035AC1933